MVAITIDGKQFEEIIEKYPGVSREQLEKWVINKCKFYNSKEDIEKFGFEKGKKFEFNEQIKDNILLVDFDYQPLPTQKDIDELREKELEVFTYDELMKYKPIPQEWLIENQIPKGEVGLLVGKRGERKTFTAYYLALCLASMKKAFGRDNVPEKKKVLIIDEETGKNELAKRMKALGKGLGIKESLEIKFISFEGLKLDQGNEKFRELILDFKPDLIIVDCFQRCVSFEVDKDNQSISEFFTGVVRQIIKKFGTTWLFIHHLRKSPAMKHTPDDLLDEVRGGSELTNYCRFVLLTQLPKHQDKQENVEMAIFRVLKMSNAPVPEPMVISFETNDDSIKVSYEGIPKEILNAEVRCANAIREYLTIKQMIEFQTKDINEAAEEIGMKKTFLSYGLKILYEQGFLTKPKRGYWKVSGDISQTKLKEEKS